MSCEKEPKRAKSEESAAESKSAVIFIADTPTFSMSEDEEGMTPDGMIDVKNSTNQPGDDASSKTEGAVHDVSPAFAKMAYKEIRNALDVFSHFLSHATEAEWEELAKEEGVVTMVTLFQDVLDKINASKDVK